jgi:hypothetical protein
VILEGKAGQLTAAGVEYRTSTGEVLIAMPTKGSDFERRRYRLA